MTRKTKEVYTGTHTDISLQTFVQQRTYKTSGIIEFKAYTILCLYV